MSYLVSPKGMNYLLLLRLYLREYKPIIYSKLTADVSQKGGGHNT